MNIIDIYKVSHTNSRNIPSSKHLTELASKLTIYMDIK